MTSDREDSMARRSSQTTTDHEAIRRWAEERGATPSEVATTASGDEIGIIRLDFPGYSGEGKLKPISWDEWFEKFDASNLALVYQDTTARGQKSNFNKLVARDTAEARAEGERTTRGSTRRAAGSRGGSARSRSQGSRSSARTERRKPARSTGARPAGKRAASRSEAARTTRSGRSAAKTGTKAGARGGRTTAGRSTTRRGGTATSARKSSKRAPGRRTKR
jgi:hypothetical protein